MSSGTFRHYFLTLNWLLTLALEVLGQSCLFPEFLQRREPWSADYKNELHQLAIFKGSRLTLTVPMEGGGIEEHERVCFQQYKDRYMVRQTSAENKSFSFLCMQFVPRGDNIVQFKMSRIQHKNSPDLCDDRNLEFDPYPFVHMAMKLNTSTTCPFSGGYNMMGVYGNQSLICHDILPLRLESECDKGSGIIFNFRKSECTPKIDIRPKERITFRTHCVTHWIQGEFTFIILQLVDDEDKHFCLRTSDPLNNIREAYLWLKVKCDLAPYPATDYVHLKLEKRPFSSICADELDLCSPQVCDSDNRKHCGLTCGHCQSENQIGPCAFQEQFRGHWIDSGKDRDISINIEAYSLNAGILGKYDCLNLGSDNQPEKKVLLELNNNGCVPRYACVEMEKVTSSVMKFRLSDRINWPLTSSHNQKEHVCKSRNFGVNEVKERPARLIINKANLKEVPCELPQRLQNSVAFKEYTNACGGCLHYEPLLNANQFFVRPINCSSDHYMTSRVVTYSCLATFPQGSNSHSVVVKTNLDDEEQYFYWVFGTDIKVLKASDAYLYESEASNSYDYVQAQFFILPDVNAFCKDFLLLPHFMPTTTTPSPPVASFDEEEIDILINDNLVNNNNNHHGDMAGEVNTKYEGKLGPQTESSRGQPRNDASAPGWHLAAIAVSVSFIISVTRTLHIIAVH